MNLNRLRPYTTVIMTLSFVLISFTGVILFLAPEGPMGRGWNWLGISKHEYKDIHLYLGVLAMILVLFHAYLNSRPLFHYLHRTTALWKHPLLWGVMGVLIVISCALFFSVSHHH
ncbi:DUF4405 domain-containing protein [Celerinatantimonas sp. YJH-8]|uniref:DUF4405 domain-containing protein n=1 Tax=Celerinatantimonas sp. YJH-8 TaxID=3228714 RepID=UPI0038C9EFF5